MTELKHKVKRGTSATFRGRQLILIIEPPDLVTVREKGRRKGYTLNVETIYKLAAQAEADQQRRERSKKRKGKRR